MIRLLNFDGYDPYLFHQENNKVKLFWVLLGVR